MNYLVVQDWASTHGNHAGMLHMCDLLKEKYPNEYYIISMRYPFCKKTIPISGGKIRRLFIRRLNTIISKYGTFDNLLLLKSLRMLLRLSSSDKVFLLEYLHPEVPQWRLARVVKRIHPNSAIFGLAHLTKASFAQYGVSQDQVLSWMEPIEKVLTLGSSLSSYLVSKGIPKENVSTGFHYVDTEYYTPTCKRDVNGRIRAIVIGSMMRDYDLLSNIIKSCQCVDWIVCLGNDKEHRTLFSGLMNVTVFGYLDEDQLKKMMNLSDISVSVMVDTIGSNVITTSLAMGLAQVVSDVGSIRDYCDNSNTIFCKNCVEDFSNAINYLVDNPRRIANMSSSARERAECLTIDNIHIWFDSLSR